MLLIQLEWNISILVPQIIVKDELFIIYIRQNIQYAY